MRILSVTLSLCFLFGSVLTSRAQEVTMLENEVTTDSIAPGGLLEEDVAQFGVVNFGIPDDAPLQENALKLDNPYKFKGTELIAPGVLLTVGIVGLENSWWKGINRDIRDDLQKNDHKKIRIDDYTQFLPSVAIYGLKLCGMKGKHDLIDVTIIYGTTALLLAATLYPMKDFIISERPNNKGFDSFPSGHTAIAFAGAEILRREYWDVSPWIGVAGYLVAAGTGFMRMYNNAHWLNDVIAGAGLGILCAEAAYWLYPAVTKTFFKKRYDANIYLAPTLSTRHLGLSCAITF